MEPPAVDVQLTQQLPSDSDASTPPQVPLHVEPAVREPVKIASYNLEGFGKDAPLVSVAYAGKHCPSMRTSPLKSATAKFEVGLEKMGGSKTVPDEIYVQFKIATQGLGIRCSRCWS